MAKLGKINDKDKYFIINAMDDWVRIVDTRGKTIFINESFKRAVKESKELKSYVGQNASFLNGTRNQAIKKTTMIEEKLIDDRYFSIKSSPIYEDDKLIGIIEVYRDITRESLLKIELFNKNRDMVEDIRFVRKIQTNILPKEKTYGRLSLRSIYLPTDDVSGDFFDIIRISEDKYALYIADIMGHGVKASIMTMFIKVTMNAIFDKHPTYSPSKVLFKLREKFFDLDMQSSQYFTSWLGIFDLKESTLIFSNAGHNCPPIFYSKKKDRVNFLLASGRMISNIIEPDNYDEKKVKFAPNDKILLFSDGAIESKNKDKKEYGLEGLKDRFAQSLDLEDVREGIEEFTWGKQEDDISLVQIDIKEK
ncbi:MAG: SpoIIE family protein phosphatase [Anaerococcus sp.]|nr:SpoIIE family protein phosphatase [Anaerococcus sp.]